MVIYNHCTTPLSYRVDTLPTYFSQNYENLEAETLQVFTLFWLIKEKHLQDFMVHISQYCKLKQVENQAFTKWA